jgi:hypothetical protein
VEPLTVLNIFLGAAHWQKISGRNFWLLFQEMKCDLFLDLVGQKLVGDIDPLWAVSIQGWHSLETIEPYFESTHAARLEQQAKR